MFICLWQWDWMGPWRLTNPPSPHFTEPLMSAEKDLTQGHTEYFLAELELEVDRESCWRELGGREEGKIDPLPPPLHGQVFSACCPGRGWEAAWQGRGREEALLFLRLVHLVAKERQQWGRQQNSRRGVEQEGGRGEHWRTWVRSRQEEFAVKVRYLHLFLRNS